jgi:hypothetical protein
MGRSLDQKACFNNACRQESLCQPSDTAKEKSPFPKLGATVSAMESSPRFFEGIAKAAGMYGAFLTPAEPWG